MRVLVTLISGSRAYGTAVPGSDTDLKGVHIPDARDIVLQRSAPALKLGEGDHSSHALHRFLEMAADGDVSAIEMLCAPPALWSGEPDPLWLELADNRHRLLSSSATFSRYAGRQSAAFGGRTIRLATWQRALAAIDEAIAREGSRGRLEAAVVGLVALGDPAITVGDRPDGKGRMVTLGEKQLPLGTPLSAAKGVVEGQMARYGARTLRAAADGGVDWKALMHGIRIAEEGAEFHLTGMVTLPRPNADWLRAVRLGQVPMEQVEEATLSAMERCSAAAANSIMPEEPDRQWLEDFLSGVYGQEVARRYGPDPDVARLGRAP